ncbi:hypothetical protein [Candidatus Albibeggiatoa sp. nov. NOAA]|uniref:hypothetical protein n=1 Tax=Candidatus Albibeggiatoa sp. nov. NOAA TaxID=3162724 RepID=UPI0032F608AD|nr:hypothetical protein [Thiotrichaceae bacterium]
MKLTTILKMISLLPQKQYSDILRHINSQIYFKSFIALICLFSLQTATAQWQENFALSSLNNEVSAVLHDDNNIYVAGHFTSDGDTQLNYIAKWNGTNWEALGDGFNATVYALTLDIEGNLIASGEFSSSGSKPLSHIAKWDGDSWEALGDGLDASASTLILDSEGNLIAGGSFFSSGSTFIAKWNGTSWEPLGEGFDGYVYALT